MDVAEKRMLDYDKKRGLFLPTNYSPGLSELIGIIFGDGHLAETKSYSYRVSIFGHSIDDYEYHTVHLRNLIRQLFGLETKISIRKDMNCMASKIYSKRIIIFLKNLGLKTGRKKELHIPKWILAEDVNMVSFLRGFADTDGSLALKKRYKLMPYYPVISLTSKSKILMEDASHWLRTKGFSFYFGHEKRIDKRSGKIQEIYKIYINGHHLLIKWANLIGFNNKKHIYKYKIWKERNKEKLFKLNILSN